MRLNAAVNTAVQPQYSAGKGHGQRSVKFTNSADASFETALKRAVSKKKIESRGCLTAGATVRQLLEVVLEGIPAGDILYQPREAVADPRSPVDGHPPDPGKVRAQQGRRCSVAVPNESALRYLPLALYALGVGPCYRVHKVDAVVGVPVQVQWRSIGIRKAGYALICSPFVAADLCLGGHFWR